MTVQTNPPQDAEGTDLYVWGVNRELTQSEEKYD
jgi:hypothetical protein